MSAVKMLVNEFKDSLEDFVLSKAEKRSIKQDLAQHSFSKSEVMFLNSELKKMAQDVMDESNKSCVINWLFESQKLLLNIAFNNTESNPPKVAFSPGEECLGDIIYTLRNARQKIDVCVFTISDDRIFDVMEDAFKRGISVRVITDNDKQFDKGSDVEKIRSIGIPVKVDCSKGHMHHKFAIVDDQVLINGSYNWTRSAATRNQENVVTTDDGHSVESFKRQFEKLWRETEQLT